MRLVDFVMLIDNSSFTQTETFRRIEMDLRDAIDHVRWPPNGPDFAIYPESGKKRNEGNGVRPIKIGFQTLLQERGWRLEQRYPGVQDEVRPGAFDAWIELTDDGFPYFKFWSSMPVRGFLAVVSVEHDRESLDVPRIPKGTDGRAIG